jgi:hypothetical protein
MIMARYRAGYDLDFGRRDFDSRRARMDVGSHGYDRGYRRGGFGGGAYERPWVGGYRDGYQGGSGGIGVDTSGRAMEIQWEQERNRRDYDRDFRTRRYGQDYRGGGYGGGEYSGQERGGRYVRGARGGYDRGYHGYDREYREDLERNRPRFSPVGGMAPTMGGSYVTRGNRAWPYDRWFNEWSRWF